MSESDLLREEYEDRKGKLICTVCSVDFSLDEGGISGVIGTWVNISVCPSCLGGVLEMAEEVMCETCKYKLDSLVGECSDCGEEILKGDTHYHDTEKGDRWCEDCHVNRNYEESRRL